MTSHEIEDVLSSIRRLVSEDLRPAARVPAPAPREAEKLLLTPSLRVVPDPVAVPPVAPAPEPPLVLAPEPSVAADLPLPPVDDYDDTGLDDDAAPAAPVLSAAAPEANWIEVEEDWPDAYEEPVAVPFVAHPRRATLAEDPLARAWADRAEAEVRAELQGARVTPPPAAAPAADPGPSLFDGDTAEIDEEALRDIVREILREELAGTLGERITRNVRKLVRVEINRALTAREFE